MRQERKIDPSIGPRGLAPDLFGRRRVHPLVGGVAEALEGVGARWALLRGEYDLADPRGDVDILVDGSRDLGALEQALRPLGIVAVPRVGAGAHLLFMGYDRPARRWIEFDIEWDLDFGPQLHFTLNWLAPALRSGAARAVLARRRRSPDLPGMWVLDPDDAFWALLLHVIIDKAVVKDHHADRLAALCEHATPSSPLARVVADSCPVGWDVDRIIRCARTRDWPTLVALGRMLARRSCTRHFVALRALALMRGLHRLGRSVRSVSAMRGVSVAVVGSTGAGRCALVDGLLSERPLKARLVRPGRRLVAAYHRLRGRTIVFEARDEGLAACADRAPDVVIALDPQIPVTTDVLADAVDVVWRARGGDNAGGEVRAGSPATRRAPGRNRTATPRRTGRKGSRLCGNSTSDAPSRCR